MIKFLFKGLLRDRQRSLLPVIVVIIGVFLTVFLHCWITGIFGEMVDFNSKFATGHVKIMTRAYADKAEQLPNDLALTGITPLIENLDREYPDMEWIGRIRFGGLMDVPDEQGETRAQGPAAGWGVDLLSPGSKEAERLNIPSSLVRGRLPQKPGEVIISEDFAVKLGVGPGESISFIGSTMLGGMAVANFTIAGTVRFGTVAVDRGAVIADLADMQSALDMPDGAGEILGYFNDGVFDKEKAIAVKEKFMAAASHPDDPFEPVMLTLRDQNGLDSMVDYMGAVGSLISFIFILAMSLVLWNAGLLGGLRRYGEVGLRLAMGESKGHVYRSMLGEAVLIGGFGSVAGSVIGLAFALWLQKNGLDISGFMKNASMMIPSVFRTEVTTQAYYIGFIPGLFATVIGTALAGIGIYKRQTAQLFKELQ